MTTLADSVAMRPATMLLVNLVTNATLQPQFNPTEFEEKLGAAWSKLAVPGLSHQVKQFGNTLDVTFDFELFYRVADGGPTELKRVLDARTFLYAACHPRSQTSTLNGAGPPRLLFVWPGLISLNCVITGLAFKYTMFNTNGNPIAYSAKVTLEEIRDSLVTMEDIISQGTQNRSVG
jgi:hypothetical protein